MIRKLDTVNIEDLKKLNDFLLSESSSLLYISVDYISLLENYLENTLTELWISTNDTNEIIGYFPIMFRLNSSFGNVCNSLPFYGSNGGITVSSKLNLAEKNNVRKELLNAVLKSTKEKNCVSVTFITNPLESDFNEWISKNFVYQLTDERIGQLTPLPSFETNDLEKALMNLYEDPRPRNIRKALKENIIVYSSHSDEAFDFLYATHFENIMSINGIPKEKTFFETIKNSVPKERYKIYIAEKNGEKIGALLLFYFNKTVEYFTPAIVEQHRNLHGSSNMFR